ncbi:SRFR1 [Scenedesmus sp. PABB004]|nr:SRFR1 [Scenedesmus sp. PABB004]
MAPPPSPPGFAALALQADFGAALKAVDAALGEARAEASAALHRLAALHLNRGLCNQRLGLSRAALKDYDAALVLQPSNVSALLRKGQVLSALGKLAEARAVWQTAAGLADPASDLEVLLEIQVALQAPGAAAPPPAGPAPATGAAPAAAAAPGTPDTSAAEAAVDSGAAAQAPPAAKANGVAGGGGGAAAPATGAKPRLAKGFLKPASGAAAVPAGGGKRATAGSGGGAAEGVEEIDCAAQQQQQQAAGAGGGAAAGSFGQQVQQMAQSSAALQIAINQINAGQVEQAEGLLDGVLATNPADLSALVARGTARALRRRLKEAVEDFSAAILIEPRYPDTYKRRGQARSALGDHAGALEDLDRAAKLMADLPAGADALAGGGAGDCHAERGMLYQKLRDYRRAARALAKATELDPSNAQAWNYLGLCRVSMGDIRSGCAAYERALSLDPGLREAVLNLGQALKEEGRVREAERALTQAMTLDGAPCLAAYRLLATMRQGQGRQADAIKLLDKALGFKRPEQRVELLYLRAICHHALGSTRAAVADYEACMNAPPRADDGPAGEESRTAQFLCFYQREMALFAAHAAHRRAADLCLDSELPPLFKECWCKKGPPSQELFATYSLQPPLPAEGRGSGSGGGARDGAGGGAGRPDQVAALTGAADTVGALLQNYHQGFLPNVRQQRAAGYAAAELAQAVGAVLAERAAGRDGLWVNSAGASGQGGCSGRHLFGWRDAMDIVVKWRQLSEPADQVVWVDRLTRREFEAGFGSHTPMYSGQTKCVRYYMNFARALQLAKDCLLERGHAYDAANREVPLGSAEKQEAVRRATTALELYNIIGQDSWVVVPLHSLLKAQQAAEGGAAGADCSSSGGDGGGKGSGHAPAAGGAGASPRRGASPPKRISDAMVPPGCIEGTRLTLVKVPNQPDAVEFSIRTPVTPPRWKEFDAELEAAWERVLAALSARDTPAAAAAILSYAYYWYNFMPLARGTAAVGYATMLGLFWAAGAPATAPIPQDYQVDWEAILAKHPQQFADRLAAWFVPEAALPLPPLGGAGGDAAANGAAPAANGAGGRSPSPHGSDGGGSKARAALVAAAKALPPAGELPPVADVLGTLRERLAALNGPDGPRPLC